jgi:hypothetical protein
MNKRDIELAKQAGFDSFDVELFQSIVNLADLIRADEREECAKLAYEIDPIWESVSDAIRARGNNV